MISTLDLRGRRPTRAEFAALITRAEVDVTAALGTAAALVDDVRREGSAALRAQAERFDGVAPASIRVDPAEIAAATAALAGPVRSALEEAIRRVRLASTAQVPSGAVTEVGPGAVIEQRWQPVRRAGVYVPGGKAVLPSSVVMNVVPAQTAGVSEIALASPPQRDHGGRIHPVILGAAGLLGIDEVYAMGGAGAIGALAYGVHDLGLDPVDIVTGPGNVYVAAAKRAVQGVVGIDAEAGPSEVLVIADSSARPAVVAADLIGQAEHDELAAAVLVTDSPDLADAVLTELARQLPAAHSATRIRTALAGPQSAVVLVDDLTQAAAFSNAYGPEHLELQTADVDAVLALISDAGAVFVGEHSPVSLGDYLAGSNHILPTGGTARFTSGISAATFLRPQQIVRYQRDALAGVAPHIRTLSDVEALPSHGDAVDRRFD